MINLPFGHNNNQLNKLTPYKNGILNYLDNQAAMEEAYTNPIPYNLYIHHSLVPQSVVESNPAEWYYPLSRDTFKLYSSKKIPTFTPSASWTDQLYIDNVKKYLNQIDQLRALYDKAVMGAKDLRYLPVPAGRGPLNPSPLYPGTPTPLRTYKIIDAQGNYVDDYTPYFRNTSSTNTNKETGNLSKNVDRITYDNSKDKSGDAFSYDSNPEDRIYGFHRSTVSGLRDWNYNPYLAANHPDYDTRQGNIASWDRVEGVPTLRHVEPVLDGDRYFARARTIPDYSASLERFTHANGNNTRLPNYSGKVTVADLEASGLLSKPLTIQYEANKYGKKKDGTWGYDRKKGSEESVRTARLQDLFTDRLLVPGKVDRSVQVSKLLSDAIGDARRNAILNTASSNNYNHKPFGKNILSAARTHTLGRAHLSGVDNLSLPITFVDDVRGEGKGMRYAGDGLYTRLDELFPMSSVDPRYKMYRDNGIVRVLTNTNSSSWSPGSSKIKLSRPDLSPHNGHLLDNMRAASGNDKFNMGTVIGADYHHNDFPANGSSQGDVRSALLHEGIHASTGFNSNIIDSEELYNKRKLERDMRAAHDKNSSNKNKLLDVWYRAYLAAEKLEKDQASRTTALAAALGVSRDDPNMTSRGYANNSEAEMLRALHHAKSGFARYLISLNKLQPDAVVDEVQNPDKFLDFMRNVYAGSMRGPNDDPTSYSFPSSMSQVGTENEMARSIAGIQPLVQTLLNERLWDNVLNNPSPQGEEIDQLPSPKDNHIFRNWNGNPNRILWKDKIYTPAQQLYIFRNHIWPQVRNNNADKYRAMA